MALNGIAANTTLQIQAPDRLRGRVMGFYSFVVLGMAPFGSLQAGWVAEHFGVRAAVALGGPCASWWQRDVRVADGTGGARLATGLVRAALGRSVAHGHHADHHLPPYGAGGSEVARRVAEALGWRLVDNELVERVAARAGLSAGGRGGAGGAGPDLRRAAGAHARGRDARAVPAARGRGGPPSRRGDLVRITESVVAEIAAEGQGGAGGPGGAGRAGPARPTRCT